MSPEDKTWLLEHFPKYMGRTMMKETLQAYYKAEMLLNEWDKIRPRSCSCQLGDLAREVNTKYEKFLN